MRALRFCVLALSLVSPGLAFGQTTGQFRVCADPENLPFSNRNQEGFENKIADLIAKELGAVGGYAGLRDYTALGGTLTVFTLP